jgi:hypothetical protein
MDKIILGANSTIAVVLHSVAEGHYIIKDWFWGERSTQWTQKKGTHVWLHNCKEGPGADAGKVAKFNSYKL